MANLIKNIRSLSNAGILADRTSRTQSLEFRRYNLIYGFNGSGKSTISRLFASLQNGTRDAKLPQNCKFEFELDNGAKHSLPNSLSGLERRVLVFNADFVEQNIKWSIGHANPVFYIGREQAELATKLAELEASISSTEQIRNSSASVLKATEKAFSTFKRERARLISDRLRLHGKKYESPQLVQDYISLNFEKENAILSDEILESSTITCRQDEPMPRVNEILIQNTSFAATTNQARMLARKTLGTTVIKELEQHPDMLLWVKKGAEYHSTHQLENCLFCGNAITNARRELLEQALDNRLKEFLSVVEMAYTDAKNIQTSLQNILAFIPHPESISSDIRTSYKDARTAFINHINEADKIINEAIIILEEKRIKPTQIISTTSLKSESDVMIISISLTKSLSDINTILQAHNARVDKFVQHQDEARLAIRRHFLALSQTEYNTIKNDENMARSEATSAEEKCIQLSKSIAKIRSEIMQHGPAADKINKLITSYLGHGELTISAISEGYEIHRLGRLVDGDLSEGEKTAIALCYFISTLDSDGKSLKDMIVVIDDPISSLDTRALNFCCSLIISRLSNTAQLFLLTHNQQCMNEFKKNWKNKARQQKDPTKPPTATFIFIDVSIPHGNTTRSANLVEMSRLLREYDSEYHFLFNYVLDFEASHGSEYEYAYMMPNILRRVLEVFLSFRCPGNAPFVSKIDQICIAYPQLNRDLMLALDRLVQVESHSDNLDDLISFSSMTLEETRGANSILLAMMEIVDPQHLSGLRHLCR